MIRRDPTRIELTMDDIQEYAQMRRDAEKRTIAAGSSASGHVASSASKSKTNNQSIVSHHEDAAAVARQTRAEAIRERIGFDPTPRNS